MHLLCHEWGPIPVAISHQPLEIKWQSGGNQELRRHLLCHEWGPIPVSPCYANSSRPPNPQQRADMADSEQGGRGSSSRGAAAWVRVPTLPF